MWRIAAVWLVAFASLLIASVSRAGSGKSVNVVLMLEGSDGEALRRDLEAALPSRFTLQDPADTRAALSKEGVMGSFADSLSNQRVRSKALTAVHNSLKQQGMPALIAVRTRRGRNSARELRIVLVMSEQVEPVVEEDITLGRNEKMANKVGPLLGGSARRHRSFQRESRGGRRQGEPPTNRAKRPGVRGAAPSARACERKGRAAARARPQPRRRSRGRAAPTKDPTRDTAAKKKRDKIDYTNASHHRRPGHRRRRAQDDRTAIRSSGPLRLVSGSRRRQVRRGRAILSGGASGMPFAKDIGIVVRYCRVVPVLESKTRDGSKKLTGYVDAHCVRRARSLPGRTQEHPVLTSASRARTASGPSSSKDRAARRRGALRSLQVLAGRGRRAVSFRRIFGDRRRGRDVRFVGR